MKVRDESEIEFDFSDSRTFYLESSLWKDTCLLTGEDSHHLSRVLRLKQGDEIRLMDGLGREGFFVIDKIAKNGVAVHRVREIVHPRPSTGLIIAAAWTKAARRSWIFEKAVEFGAAGIWFWQAERSQFPVPEEPKEQWQAQMIAGMKQCRNPWLPTIRTFPHGVEEVIRAASDIPHKHILLENTLGDSPMLTSSGLAEQGTTLCIIGPEGGFSPSEAERYKASGFMPFSLGSRILRWETVAVLCLGLHWWGGEVKAKA